MDRSVGSHGAVGGAPQERTPGFSQRVPSRRTGLGPRMGRRFGLSWTRTPAAPQQTAVQREVGAARPPPANPSFFHPGVSWNETCPLPGQSAPMKGGPRTERGASSRLGCGIWQRRGCPAWLASGGGRRGTASPLELLLPQDTYPHQLLPTPT